ncbi:MAG: hypothetical protein ABIU77_24405 [Ferruginibacter sp.]
MTKVKDFLSVLKDGLLLTLFLLLIFFPLYFNKMLERAGFTEGSLMGFSWKQKALESKEVAGLVSATCNKRRFTDGTDAGAA